MAKVDLALPLPHPPPKSSVNFRFPNVCDLFHRLAFMHETAPGGIHRDLAV